MVCKITHPEDIHRAIYYNEHKVEKNVASLLHAENFLKDTEHLNVIEKKERFDQLIALNKRVELHTLHVSINFAPEENLPKEKLLAIAQDYMEQLGFGDQPYLVYQHDDAGHPHLHIVSTNIRDDGTRIDMNLIAIKKSEPARKAIEEKYGLVKAQGRNQAREKDDIPQKIIYGKTDTKRAITNVLEFVLKHYRLHSLPELNAVLSLYNLKANRGQPDSRIYKHRGLVYQVTDDNGQGLGVPIKASSIYFKPGLKYLEKKFKQQKKIDPAEITRVRMAVDASIRKAPSSLEDWKGLLRKDKIEAVTYANAEGKIYGLSYVDFEGKRVLKASDLGKEYSVRKLFARLGLEHLLLQPKKAPQQKKKKASPNASSVTNPNLQQQQDVPGRSGIDELLQILFRQEYTEPLPYELRPKKKKKQKSR